MNAFQNATFETTIFLEGYYGGLSGIQAADVSLRTRKMGDNTFTTLLALTPAMWVELGDGFYVLRLPATYFDRVGSFFYEIFGSQISPVYNEITVAPMPLPMTRPDRCVVAGTIADLAGAPVLLGAKIAFRLTDAPVAVQDIFIQGGFYETRADAYGNFSISLVRGVKVMVSIELLGLQQVITVPDQDTARLIDLLPPLV